MRVLRHGTLSGGDRGTARICGECLAAGTLEAADVVASFLGMQTVLEEKPILVLRVAGEAGGGRDRMKWGGPPQRVDACGSIHGAGMGHV